MCLTERTGPGDTHSDPSTQEDPELETSLGCLARLCLPWIGECQLDSPISFWLCKECWSADPLGSPFNLLDCLIKPWEAYIAPGKQERLTRAALSWVLSALPGPHALGMDQRPSSSSPPSGHCSRVPAPRRKDIVKSDSSEGTGLGPELKVWTPNLLLPSSLNI